MLDIRRIIKKTTYLLLAGLVVLAVFALFVLPKLSFFSPSAELTSPAPPKSIAVENIDTVIHDNSIDIVARVRNPNPRAGIPEYAVTFILLDEADRELKRIEEKAYLLPGSLNYLARLDVSTSSPVSRVTVETPEQPVFAAVPPSISLPTFNSFLRDRTIIPLGSRQVEVQKGVVTNTGTLGWQRVDITGVAFDAAGNVVGIGQTFIGKFSVGEQREFTIQWPAPPTPTQRVIVLPTTNVFKEDNVLSVVGDPNLLR